jgi:hypothetical protein
MMTKDDLVSKDTALKVAIDALLYGTDHTKAVKACKEALDTEQVREDLPAQQPVAWMHRHAGEITEFNDFQSCEYCEPLYTHPHQWVGLTDDEMHEVIIKHVSVDCSCDPYEFARAVEQALKDKNT